MRHVPDTEANSTAVWPHRTMSGPSGHLPPTFNELQTLYARKLLIVNVSIYMRKSSATKTSVNAKDETRDNGFRLTGDNEATETTSTTLSLRQRSVKRSLSSPAKMIPSI